MAAGRLHVDEVLAELSATELREWEAYAMLEPFGAPWHQTALLAALIAESNRNPEARSEPFTEADFLPSETDVPVLQGDETLPEPEEPHWMKMKRLLQTLADAQKENQNS